METSSHPRNTHSKAQEVTCKPPTIRICRMEGVFVESDTALLQSSIQVSRVRLDLGSRFGALVSKEPAVFVAFPPSCLPRSAYFTEFRTKLKRQASVSTRQSFWNRGAGQVARLGSRRRRGGGGGGGCGCHMCLLFALVSAVFVSVSLSHASAGLCHKSLTKEPDQESRDIKSKQA